MKKNPIFAPPTESAICPTVGGIFIEKKTKRYARLANGNVGNFQDNDARECDGLREQRGLIPHLHHWVFLRPPLEEVVYSATLLYLMFALGCWEAVKPDAPTGKQTAEEL